MYSIETSLGFTMGKLSQKMSEIFEKSLNAKGITPKQYAILVVVYEHEELTQKLVADQVAIDRTTMGQHIDALESKDYIKRVRSNKDKRAYNLVLTSEGLETVSTLWDALVASENEIIKSLSQKDQFCFRKFVKCLYDENM